MKLPHYMKLVCQDGKWHMKHIPTRRFWLVAAPRFFRHNPRLIATVALRPLATARLVLRVLINPRKAFA